ncbi:hypothetical protein BHM03_00026338 [Ensete ventricosum]|nr:hypothetical protein BHM03_00026338 [Ensete ventricosum]
MEKARHEDERSSSGGMNHPGKLEATSPQYYLAVHETLISARVVEYRQKSTVDDRLRPSMVDEGEIDRQRLIEGEIDRQ